MVCVYANWNEGDILKETEYIAVAELHQDSSKSTKPHPSLPQDKILA